MRGHRWILSCFLILIIASSVAAQEQDCSPVLERALEALDVNCSETGRNAACYGFDSVSATFFETQPDDVFDLPADVVDVPQLESIRTLPYDIETEIWGVALMNVQANLPNTFPGQGVIFVLMGDTDVANGVDPANAYVPVDPVEVITTTRTNLRSAPTERSNVLFVADEGAALPADAQSSDGQWVRVNYEDRQVWAARALVTGEIDGLPVFSADSFTPMQAFYLTTGVGDTDCESAPDTLLIQGPRNTEISFTVNQASVRIGSTILLETLAGETILQLSVIDGEAQVDNLIIPEGFKATAGLSEVEIGDGSVRPVIQSPWTACQPLDEEDRLRIETLTNLPTGVLYYPVEVPEQTNALCASPEQIAAAQAAARQSVCGDNFRPTSPLDGLPYGEATFYWDPATNAARYRVNVSNLENGMAVSYLTEGTETTVNGDVGPQALGAGFSFAWNVDALDERGGTLCSTDRVALQREAGGGGSTGTRTCLTGRLLRCDPACTRVTDRSCTTGYACVCP